jgi:hypothetical protein
MKRRMVENLTWAQYCVKFGVHSAKLVGPQTVRAREIMGLES